MTSSISGGTPVVGTRVLTADGQEIGHVKEIVGDCFKIDAPMQPDYWLGTDTIAGATGGGVKLSFTMDGLGEAKQEGPMHKGFHPHNNYGSKPSSLSRKRPLQIRRAASLRKPV